MTDVIADELVDQITNSNSLSQMHLFDQYYIRYAIQKLVILTNISLLVFITTESS